MAISDGQPVNAAASNAAWLSRTTDTSTIGRILLNHSGSSSVEDIQGLLNKLQNDRHIFLAASDQVLWSAPNLTFPELTIYDKVNGITLTIDPDTVSIDDGESLFVELDRSASTTVTPIIDSAIPEDRDVYRIVSRVGDNLYWFDGTLQFDGKDLFIGQGGTDTVGYQELLGIGNGTNTDFPLTFIPANEHSILVFANGLRQETAEWTYNEIGNQVEFAVAPSAAVNVYVFYLTEGDTLTIPSPSGTLQTQYIQLSSMDEMNKAVVLSATPAAPTRVLLDVIGGTSQAYGLDFSISSNVLTWDGLQLDGILGTGDIIRVHYQS